MTWTRLSVPEKREDAGIVLTAYRSQGFWTHQAGEILHEVHESRNQAGWQCRRVLWMAGTKGRSEGTNTSHVKEVVEEKSLLKSRN